MAKSSINSWPQRPRVDLTTARSGDVVNDEAVNDEAVNEHAATESVATESEFAAAAAAEQLVEHVEADGTVIEIVTRAKIRDRALRHRSVYIVVQRPDDGAVLAHKRADWKDVYPGAWDLAFGGLCDPGESWEEAGHRELMEEAGIEAALVDRGSMSYETDEFKLIGWLYEATSSGPFVFNDGEVTDTQWVPMSELAGFVADNECPEDTVALVVPRLLA